MHIYAQKETKFSLGLVLVTSNRGKVASQLPGLLGKVAVQVLSLIHISEPTRQYATSRMPSSA